MNARILIVDDEPANVLLLESFLADSRTETLGITDSREVEHSFLQFVPDLVLLDLHMPTPDGREVLRRLRGLRHSLGFLPVIVLTADSSRLARNSALLLGADDFLTKPLDRSEVMLKVRYFLRLRAQYVDLVTAKEVLERQLKAERARAS
jgi:putative two-component system response regulator